MKNKRLTRKKLKSKMVQLYNRRLTKALAIIIVAGLGTYLLTTSHAQSPFASREAEQGALASGASVISDINASGGSGVKFGTNSSNASNPLIWGTNLSMNNSQDQFLTNSSAATVLQSLHTTLVRMPLRDNLTTNDYTTALNKIKQIGATPLIITHGATYSGGDPYPTSSAVLQIAKQIFPTQTVYVDFGNEEDLAGASTCTVSNCIYVNGTYGWNTEISKFKAITGSNFKYGGPVNFQYNESYADTFAQIANPRPDFIVWHAYAGSCGHNTGTGVPDSESKMLASIPNWGAHIQQIATDFNSLKDSSGVSLAGEPIIIDEWNYASDLGVAGSNSPCWSNDQAFINNFFSTTINTFINAKQYNLLGAAEYEAFVGTDESMIDGSNNVTFQGQAFKASYEAAPH